MQFDVILVVVFFQKIKRKNTEKSIEFGPSRIEA